LGGNREADGEVEDENEVDEVTLPMDDEEEEAEEEVEGWAAGGAPPPDGVPLLGGCALSDRDWVLWRPDLRPPFLPPLRRGVRGCPESILSIDLRPNRDVLSRFFLFPASFLFTHSVHTLTEILPIQLFTD
jgi:hypothetical protein